jgi:phage recombination protein Bet
MSNQVIEYEANGEKVKLSPNMVKQYLVSGDADVTDQEVVMFMQLAKFQHLNPFLKEAYLVKFKGKPAQIIVSKEAFMKRANANEHFQGIKAGIIVERGDEMVQLNGTVKLSKDRLIGGWATVKRDDRDETHVEVSISEFSKGQATWNSMPGTMIRKTAMVNALREAFPQELGALYTEDDRNNAQAAEEIKKERKDVTQSAKPQSSVADLINASEAPVPEEPEEVTEYDHSNDYTDVEQGNIFNQEDMAAKQG